MPTIIDITPVSSRTSAEPIEPETQAPKGRFAVAMARLKFRLRVMAFVLIAVAAVAGVLAIGLFVFLVLLGTAAALSVAMFVRRLAGGRPGTGVERPR